MKFLILAALLALTLPGELEAVKSCYQCLATDQDCSDPFVPSSMKPTPCPASASKYCQKAKAITDGINAVTRTCALACEEVDKSAGGVRVINSCCTTDDCNAGMMTSFSVIVMMTSLLMAYLAKGRF